MRRQDVTDLSIPELGLYQEARETQLFHINEPDPGVFIAESPNVVLRALDKGYEPLSFFMDIRQWEKMKDILSPLVPKDCICYVASTERMQQITGFPMTRGMLCAMRRKPLMDVEEICCNAKRIIVLENVMNPTNVGAIMRSAAAMGMDAVVLTHGCSDPLYRRTIRVSMGTVFQIPWTVLPKEKDQEIPTDLEKIHALGFKTAAMALWEDTKPIDDPGLKREEKIAILMGSESEGLKPYTIEHSDYRIKIPMAHGVDSLNVAAACAVACWELK